LTWFSFSFRFQRTTAPFVPAKGGNELFCYLKNKVKMPEHDLKKHSRSVIGQQYLTWFFLFRSACGGRLPLFLPPKAGMSFLLYQNKYSVF
jgi:hypothetical protein